MDTGSHLLFGATLAGLAMLHPVAAAEPEVAQAILVAALAGSHAPDLDTIARWKGYAAYIRVHRGVTHSLPALLAWPLLLSLPIAWLFGVMQHWLLLYGWCFAAVGFHVFLDWFNAYGVQCFRPFSKRWHHLDVLALFEPFLFALHAAGLVAWVATDSNPGVMFLTIYVMTFLYIGIRTLQHSQLIGCVRQELSPDGVCHVVPSMHWFRWQFVLETKHCFYTGIIQGRRIVVMDVYRKDEDNAIVTATLGTDGVRAFLHFAQRVYVKWTEKKDGYIVEWRDVRFWYNHKLPFGVDVQLDRDLNVVHQRVGWRKKAWDPPFV
ncbi:metal-dependent hydrolase [Paenibacillus silviterrae]|uniref:metal-dependent hydrolase n=1 Tax=Paenibacillus silviterrae TaxID=3242194 RepID=UPI002543E03D|nr:metal-dependent hydrolase [Paenibacillus chinjuensis]